MPIFEFECLQCGKRTEVIQRFSDAPLAACPHCGGEVRKLISAPAFQFKGTGWYATDYATKKGGASDKPEGKAEGKAESKPEGGSSEGKSTESKSESKGTESKSASPASSK